MILTGIKPSGTFHLGNYISTIHPLRNKESLVLIANQHALISNKDLKKHTLELFRIFLSFGFKNILIQSDIPEISELNWILNCFTEIGYLNRSHAFKFFKEENIKNKMDENKNICAGLYNYPTLMCADNAIFDTQYVAIGQDQIQHIEMAKEIVRKFNNQYDTNILKIPKPIVSDNIILGYDGNKMSKSNNNIIPLFNSNLKKNIFKIKTNSKNVNEPKMMHESPICSIYESIATKNEIDILKNKMLNGIGWGEVKEIVYEKLKLLIEEAEFNYYNIFHDFSLNDCVAFTKYHNEKIIEKVRKKLYKIKKKVY